MEWLLKHLEEFKVQHELDEEPHLRIGCNLGWMKLDRYYTLTEDSPVYLAALILHPAFRWSTVESQWSDHPDWLARGKAAVQELWEEYRNLPVEQETIPKQPTVPRKTTDLDDFMASIRKLSTRPAPLPSATRDEYAEWVATTDPGDCLVDNPIQYWLLRRRRYPRLSRMAIDLFSIPAMSTEPERIFSLAGQMVTAQRGRLQADIIGAAQCISSWEKTRHVPGTGCHGIANFKLDGQHWFELEKIELALKDFYAATLLSEGKKTSLADWFSTLDCLLREINETKDHYYNIHTEDDNNFTWKYLQSCADAAWSKCEEYYNNQQLNWQNRFPEDTDLPPAYYAAQILDPYRKWAWFRQEWVLQGDEEKQKWFDNAQSAVKQLWETEYKGRYPVEMLPPPIRKERDPDAAFDRQREHKRIRIDAPVSATDLYEQYISTDRLHDEEAGCDEAIAYWLSRYDSQRDLARFALDLFAISPMSDECERLFSSAKLTIVDRRGRLKADIIEACECLRAWYGKPQVEDNSDSEDSENDNEWVDSY
ncbi:restless-like transposase [Ilyonectria robusta]